jgi:hypothetical protein
MLTHPLKDDSAGDIRVELASIVQEEFPDAEIDISVARGSVIVGSS